jgi:hypothetical protein
MLRADQRVGIDRASVSGAHSPRSIGYIFPVDAHPARRNSSVIRSGRKTSPGFVPLFCTADKMELIRHRFSRDDL